MDNVNKWEYLYHFMETAPDHDMRAVTDALNIAGEKGWELVSMEAEWDYACDILDYIGVKGWYMTFKRPKPFR